MSGNRSRDFAILTLLSVGLLPGLLCFREAGRRSLFTETIDGRVLAVATRTEKHPGQDDRYYLTIEDAAGRRTLEVDRAVASLLHGHEGAMLGTTSGGEGLVVDGQRAHVLFNDDTVLLGLALWCGILVAPLAEELLAAWRRRVRRGHVT